MQHYLSFSSGIHVSISNLKLALYFFISVFCHPKSLGALFNMRHQLTRRVMLSHIGGGPALQKHLDDKIRVSFFVACGLIDDPVHFWNVQNLALKAARFFALNHILFDSFLFPGCIAKGVCFHSWGSAGGGLFACCFRVAGL